MLKIIIEKVSRSENFQLPKYHSENSSGLDIVADIKDPVNLKQNSDYRGEVKVILINHFSKIFVIRPNMRIGQIVFSPIVKIQLQLGNVNIFETKRSSKGFGSTGLE